MNYDNQNVLIGLFSKALHISYTANADRVKYYGNHFWLMHDNEKLITFVDDFVINEKDLTDKMYEKASMHNENGACIELLLQLKWWI